jgi:Flp pilus assembly protein TadB
MSSLWAKLSGALVMIVGLLGAALLFVSGQRDRAKEATSRAKAEAQSKSAVLDAERAIDTARANARTESNEVQREADQRPKGTRPSGTLRR